MVKSREDLKALFETGDIPLGEHFEDLIDSVYNKQDDAQIYTQKTPPDTINIVVGENTIEHNLGSRILKAYVWHPEGQQIDINLKHVSDDVCIIDSSMDITDATYILIY